jgi:hypothetical protein
VTTMLDMGSPSMQLYRFAAQSSGRERYPWLRSSRQRAGRYTDDQNGDAPFNRGNWACRCAALRRRPCGRRL